MNVKKIQRIAIFLRSAVDELDQAEEELARAIPTDELRMTLLPIAKRVWTALGSVEGLAEELAKEVGVMTAPEKEAN